MALLHEINNGTERFSVASDGSVKVNNAFTFPTVVTTTANYVLTAQTDGSTAWAADSIGMEDWIIAGDTGATTTITDGDTMTIAGGTNVTTSESGGTVTINAALTGYVQGNGIATRVAFWSASDTISSHADFYWDNANDRLGIGVGSAPLKKLNVQGTVRIQTNTNYYSDRTYLGDTWEFASDTTDGVTFSITGGLAATAGNYFRWLTQEGAATPIERMRITSAGNVGIGVTPTTKLDIGGMADPVVRIKSDSGGDPQLRFDAGAANRSALIKFYDNGSSVGGFISYLHNGDKMNFGSGSSTGITMTVADGAVGVLTTSPFAGAELDVYGDIVLMEKNWALRGNNASADFAIEELSGSSFSDANIKFYIKSGGDVGIGTASPVSKLSINSNGVPIFTAADMATTGLTVHNSTGGTAIQIGTYDAGAYNYIQSGYVNSASTARELRFYSGATQQMTLFADGDVSIGMTANHAMLNVNGDVRAENSSFLAGRETAGAPAFTFHDDADTGMFNVASNILCFSTAATERMRIDSAGNVGIGTTDPNVKLRIAGTQGNPATSGSTSTGFLSLYGTGSSHGLMMGVQNVSPFGSWIQAQDKSNHATNYNLLLNPNGGNVGIGLTNPSSTLTIESEAGKGTIELFAANAATTTNKIIFSEAILGDESFFIEHDGAGAGAANLLKIHGDGSGGTAGGITIQRDGNVGMGTDSPAHKLAIEGGADTVIQMSHGSGAVYNWALAAQYITNNAFEIVPSTVVGGSVFTTPVATFKSDGKVGIGTTLPGATLDVNGATYVRNVIYGYAGAGNQYGGLSWGGTDEGFLFLKDSNVTMVNINSNGDSYLNGGNIGIGTTLPSAKLQVVGDVVATNIETTTTGYLYLGGHVRLNNPGSGVFKLGQYNGSSWTDTLNITNAGTGTFTGDVIAYSDKKLKKNIKTLDGSKVYKMRGVSFDRIDTGKASSGVIAQEIQKIAPELISESNETLGVAYGNISGYLIEAIKELKAEIEELKSKPCNCNNCNCKQL